MKLERGYVQVYTGDGKGKTTAGLGLIVRALGAGLRVCLLQFLKPGRSSELRVLRQWPGLTVRTFGRPGFIHGQPGPKDQAGARRGMAQFKQDVCSGVYDLVVADEICVAVQLGLVSETELLELLKGRHPRVEVVLTGRGASRRLMQTADLVTQMQVRKHYFTRGVKARHGIEA